MEYSRTQIDLMQVKPSSLEPYPGPFLEPGIRRRIRITAILRSLRPPGQEGLPSGRQGRDAPRPSRTPQRNCSKYFEFQFVWPELMARLDGDQILRTALVQSVTQRYARSEATVRGGVRLAAREPALAIDPGVTSEIRLNMAE